MSEVFENLLIVKSKILEACRRSGRNLDSVELIAVSKTFSVELVRDAFQAGQIHFGESKVQEAESKISAMPESLRWNFIGRIQRNKVRRLLQSFDVIHAVDSLKLATYIDAIARELGLFPKVFLQVNIAGEFSKGGYVPNELHAEMERLLSFDRLKIEGLMCIPPSGSFPESARVWFAALRELRDQLEIDFGWKSAALSMGMSGDFEVAIEEGATHVRVGSAIFGRRSYGVDGELG